MACNPLNECKFLLYGELKGSERRASLLPITKQKEQCQVFSGWHTKLELPLAKSLNLWMQVLTVASKTSN